MAYTILVESYQEFAERHGGNGLACSKTGWLVWPDGASVLQDNADCRNEPPVDPQELLKMRRLYHREALERAEAEFRRAQTDFAEAAAMAARYFNLPGPPTDAPQILEGIAGRVRLRRSQLTVIEKQLTETTTPESQRIADYQERLSQERGRAAELLKEIQSITV